MGLTLDDWQKEILNTKGSIILCSGRQVGKSTIISIRDGERAANNPNESILIISATERQAYEIFSKILNYLAANYSNLICKGKDRPTKHIIKLKNNSIIRCLPTGQSGIGIRGFTITKLTGEEASYIPDNVWNAVTPMLLTTGGDMDLLGTPHGKQGYFWECYKNEFNHFKVFHVNSEEVIRNRKISNSWTENQKVKAIEHLEREKLKMSRREYAQEYMGEFIEDLMQFFPDSLINQCMILKRPERIDRNNIFFLGVDIARMGDDESTFEIVDRTDKENLKHVENIITKKTLTTETEKRIIDLERQYNFRNIYLDAGAGTLGVSIFDHLLENDSTKRKIIAINNRDRPLDRDETRKSKLLKEDLYNNLLYLLESGKLKLLDDDEIYQSLKSVQYEFVTSKNKATRMRIFGNYTHIAEGLIRAAWCIKDKRLNIWVR